jgi:hypothetical protein
MFNKEVNWDLILLTKLKEWLLKKEEIRRQMNKIDLLFNEKHIIDFIYEIIYDLFLLKFVKLLHANLFIQAISVVLVSIS